MNALTGLDEILTQYTRLQESKILLQRFFCSMISSENLLYFTFEISTCFTLVIRQLLNEQLSKRRGKRHAPSLS